jgi:excisionase family DNA binding protein
MIDFRVSQLAQQLGVHRNTITNWIKSGRLKAKPTVGKRYLISEEAFQEFCQSAGITETLLGSPENSASVPDVTHRCPPSPTPIQREVRMRKDPIGAVMVVGGGIAGIQASLDLANSGYAVHLVERSAGIGGVMSQLDKTYPTNDCAM